MTKLLILSGSSRADSFNSKLAALLTGFAKKENADVTLVNLGDFELPIYNGDLEKAKGLPGTAAQLKKLLQENTGLVITCPEYNGFMTPLLINAIDWCTRSEDASVDLSGFSDKTLLVASASPGPGGGGRAATHLKTMLSGIGSIVFPQSLVVASAYSAFGEQGEFLDDSMAERGQRLIKNFVRFTGRFVPSPQEEAD